MLAVMTTNCVMVTEFPLDINFAHFTWVGKEAQTDGMFVDLEAC